MDGIAAEVKAVRERVGLCTPPGRGLIRLTGADRRTWLQGLITNDVLDLPEGDVFEAVILTVQGRLVTHLHVSALPDALLLDLPDATRERVLATLDRYLILEEVEIEDVTDRYRLLSLQGPRAAEALTGGIGEGSLPELGVAELEEDGEPLIVRRVSHTGEAGFDLYVSQTVAAEREAALEVEVVRLGGARVGEAALDVLRIEAGIPAWGRELDESIVPLEARLDHAISRTKGCYVGQEIIARIDARGHVNSLLVGLRPDREQVPAAGDALVAEGRPVGRVTSAAYSPTLGAPIALGYLRREFTEPGTAVMIRSGSGDSPARISALPFVGR
jgi:folate-binding protein YgfZ